MPHSYQESLITFVDVLGLRKAIGKSKGPQSVVNVLMAMRKTFRSSAKMRGVREMFLSDTYVRVCRSADVTLHTEILTCAYCQYDMLSQDYIVRGCITHGNIYMQKGANVIVGPGYIRAVELEAREAVWPRIIVDPQVLRSYRERPRWKNPHHTLRQDARYVYDLLLLDRDGYYFVNYLEVMFDEFQSNGTHVDIDWMFTKHRDLIRTGLRRKKDPGVRKKYFWLAKYHNDIVLKKVQKGYSRRKMFLKKWLVPRKSMHY